ncbi:transporter C5D6.04 [Carex littledalei]|uniref:Transporter C5D6.04 n=1 Tax=Carex littledalei TaxID=544730 RepID=A0A833QNH3_9POAL|nr:transporter C5D6.04 [Carex littledalei]
MERSLLEKMIEAQGGSGESIFATIKYALLPIAKVFTMCFLGFLMASKYVNILPANGRKLLNGLVFSLLLPCLIFSQLGRAITFEKLLQWWYIPVNVVVGSISGSLIGLIVAWVIQPPYPYFKFTIIHIGIGNIGNIPLVLIAALCRDPSNPFGDSEKCSQDGNAYISFGQWVGAIILYTYVFKMLAPPPGESFDGNEDEKQLPTSRSSPQENSNAAVEDNALVSNKSSIDNGAAPESEPLLNSSDETLTATKRFSLKRVSYHLICYIFLLIEYDICIQALAIIIGAVPFLKKLVLTDDAPLFFFTDSCLILGEAMIPCILLALGGNLVDGPGVGSKRLGLRTTAAIIIARLTFVPLAGLGIVTLADKFGFIPEGDKMFKLCCWFSIPCLLLYFLVLLRI